MQTNALNRGHYRGTQPPMASWYSSCWPLNFCTVNHNSVKTSVILLSAFSKSTILYTDYSLQLSDILKKNILKFLYKIFNYHRWWTTAHWDISSWFYSNDHLHWLYHFIVFDDFNKKWWKLPVFSTQTDKVDIRLDFEN